VREEGRDPNSDAFHPKHENPEPEIRKHQPYSPTANSKFRAQSTSLVQVRALSRDELRKFTIPKPETRDPRTETRNPKPETRNPKPEARSPKSET
jgi:hypothetical protein